MSIVVSSGSFGAPGTSTPEFVWGDFNVTISGSFTGSVQVERSLDNGTTWVVVAADGKGTPAAYTSAIALIGREIEDGALYRLNCTALSGGAINYRISVGSWRLRF